jgi:hypothetical protein
MTHQVPTLNYRNSRTTAIDRLGWGFACVIKSYGVRVGLRANEADLLSSMRELLPPNTTEDTDPAPVARIFSVRHSDGLFHLYNSGKKLFSSQSREKVLEFFEAKCRIYIAEHSPDWVFVHAGVVLWKGQLLVIPGHSLSGKTTLVRTLLQNGAIYYSDEYAVFDGEGRVYPFATPLGIRREGEIQQTKREAVTFGAEIGALARCIDWVIMTRYRKGTTKPLKELSSGNGVLALLAHTVSARRFPQRVISVLKKAVATAKIRKGYRGEAQEMLKFLLQ